MGLAAAARRQFDAAHNYFQQSLAIFQQASERQGVAWPLLGLARLALRQGQIQEACEQAQKSRAIFEEVGDMDGLARSLITLGLAAIEVGEEEKTAVPHLVQALTIAAGQQAIPIILESVTGFARRQIWQGSPEQAVNLLHTVAAHPGAEAVVREQAKQLLAGLGETAQSALPLDKIVADLLAD
jgi:tetratricopeptide (TPR) repeat protein